MELSAAKTCTLTNRMAYLIGAYLGDGSITFSKDPSVGNYFFSMNAIDREFVEFTAQCLEEYFGKKPAVFLDEAGGGWKKRGTKPLWKTVVYGKEKCLRLREMTENKTVIPQVIFEAPLSIQKWFIAGIMDSEGYVGKHYHKEYDKYQYLMGICSADVWLEHFIKMLELHGVKTGKRYKEKQIKPWHKPKFRYKLNTLSFIRSGCFFTIERKKQRLADYLKGLSAQRLHADDLKQVVI